MLFFWLISIVNKSCVYITKNVCGLGKQKNEPLCLVSRGALHSSKTYKPYIMILKQL